ncbi:MAG TPA: glycosyl hydrolase family 28 protein [Candidatus Sulfotelmatobacter sp.]|nr:glycosyl hydrolase family 28 protein [Candidatus Sulfotelmatobacter sp.]
MKLRFAPAILLFVAGSFCLAQMPPIFNVKNFGAAGDGVTLDSPAVNSAIAAAGAAGGGTVTFPAGNYFCGSIHLTNNLTLYLSNNAVILASPTNIDAPESNPYSVYQDFGHSYFHDALIWGEHLTNLAFAGPGKIDGNGNLANNSITNNQGDKAVALKLCTNVVFAGITITHAGHFGILANGCLNLTVTNIQLLCSSGNYHRDAFNLISSSDVIVSNCIIQGSDDAMVLKSDYALGMAINSHDITVTDCQIFSTQNNATQFGSETVGDFTNVTWTHLQLTQAGKAGIGITSQDGSIIDGVTYDDITMSNCACPIFLKLDLRSGQAGSPNPSVGRIRNISISDVTAVHSVSIDTGISPRTNTATIDGFSSTTNIPISNIMFSNVNISTIGGYPATALANYPVQDDNWTPDSMGVRPSFGWYLRYAQNISFTNCQVHFDHNDNRPVVVADTATNILFSNFKADVGTGNTNFDISFLNNAGFIATNCVATTNAPVPDSPLRIYASNAAPAVVLPTNYVAFAFEAESLPYVANGAAAVLQNDANSSGGHWLALEATGIGQSIDYTVTNLPAGTYDVQMSWKGNTERGISTFALDGTVLGSGLDQYSSTQTYPTTDYGIVALTNSTSHSIHLAVTGENSAATGYWISTDRFIFTQLQAGLPQPPKIGGISASGANLVFRGTNGIPTATYYVLTSTNLALPPASWKALATNVFDPGGNFIFSNAPNPGVPDQFYLLKCPLLELP